MLQSLFESSGRNDRWDAVQIQLQGDKFLQLIEYLRELRPGGWHPHISFSGREHIDKALQQGGGAVLWIVPARSSGLIVKKCLTGAGYSIAHLSRSTHGISRSFFGQLTLNKFIVNSEARYVSRRLLVDGAENMRSMRGARDVLVNGGILSVTMSGDGKQQVTLKVLNGTINLATGAPNLALRTGAAVLPVITRSKKAGLFEVRIEPPLVSPSTSDRLEAIYHMAAQFSRILERELVETNPASRISLYVQMPGFR